MKTVSIAERNTSRKEKLILQLHHSLRNCLNIQTLKAYITITSAFPLQIYMCRFRELIRSHGGSDDYPRRGGSF